MNITDQFQSYDEAVSVVRQALTVESEAQYAVGDIGCILCSHIDPHKLRSKRRKEAVKKFAHDIGLAAPTVAMAIRVCRSATKKLRAEFPILLFGHWRELTIAGGLSGEALRDRAREVSDDQTPVGVLHVQLKGGGPSVNIPKWLHKTLKTAEKITPDDIEIARKNGEVSKMTEHLEEELRGLRMAIGHG